MKTRNPVYDRSVRQSRGAASGLRAGPHGVTVRDNSTEVHPAIDLYFAGGTVTDLDDDTAKITLGGAGGGLPGGGGDGTSSATAIIVLNNSGGDLNVGDVVVNDPTADNAVTTTTTEGDIHIAGVVQEPIADGFFGLVLFNGYAAQVNAPDAVRGEYAKTSTTAGEATSTTDREAGSFAVFMTGADLPDFATDAVTTTSDTPVTTLDIDIPVAPVDRLLFLGLWLESTTSAIDIPNWTLIGSTAGFYYFYRVTTGADAAVATWTSASVAVASVLLLHPTVSLAVPIEDFAYEATAAAAALSGLSDVPRFAIAGVAADVTTPGSGFTRFAGGTAGEFSDEFDDSSTFVDPWGQSAGDPTTLFGDIDTTRSGELYLQGQLYKIAPDPPFTIISSVAYVDWDLVSGFPGVGGIWINLAQAAPGPYIGFGIDVGLEGIPNHEMHVGDSKFDAAGAFVNNPHVVDIVHDASYAVAHQTKVIVHSATNVDAYVSFDNWATSHTICTGYNPGVVPNYIGLEAGGSRAGFAWFHVTSDPISGSLAGKYIGHDAAVTSPFSGVGKEADAIFAVNLLRDAMPALLLYGPDLAHSGVAVSEPLILEDGTIAILENGHAAMSEPVFV